MSKGQRRLAAIMFTDIVGYTLLAQTDESKALEHLKEHREIIRPILARHQGTEVKTMGDAFLIEFPSAFDAVRCSVDIQRTMHDRNASLPEENRLQMRVGVHVGDVVHERGDILGDAVNVSSRIEPLAEPGGVCISQQVYDHVRNKLDLTFQKLEGKTLKNVRMPVEVYRMVMPWEISGRVEADLDMKRVAVLPLRNLSSDPEDEYFADGMTEELITALSAVKDLSVIARTSVMQYKGSTKRITEIGRELNAGTLIEGSVRKAANKVRITVQLIDGKSESHIWAQNYDKQLDDIFAVQSEVASKVAETLKVQLVESTKERLEKGPTKNPEAYTLYLKGRYYSNERTMEGLRKAIAYFERAIEKDANYAQAYAGIADSYCVMITYGYISRDEGLPRAEASVQKALDLDDGLAEVQASQAAVMWTKWEFRSAGRALRAALKLNPSYARAHLLYADYLHFVEKKPEEAMAEKLRSRDLDPLSPVANLNIGAISYRLRQYDKAIEEFNKALGLFPDYWNLHVWLGGALLLKGEYDQAIKELGIALELSANGASVLSTLGSAYAMAGRTEEAKGIIAKLNDLSKEQFVSPLEFGFVFASLGDLDEAFSLFGKAVEERTPGMLETLLGDPLIIDELWGDPRYDALLDKVGLGRPIVQPMDHA